jgi:hypothetical protein
MTVDDSWHLYLPTDVTISSRGFKTRIAVNDIFGLQGNKESQTARLSLTVPRDRYT